MDKIQLIVNHFNKLHVTFLPSQNCGRYFVLYLSLHNNIIKIYDNINQDNFIDSIRLMSEHIYYSSNKLNLMRPQTKKQIDTLHYERLNKLIQYSLQIINNIIYNACAISSIDR